MRGPNRLSRDNRGEGFGFWGRAQDELRLGGCEHGRQILFIYTVHHPSACRPPLRAGRRCFHGQADGGARWAGAALPSWFLRRRFTRQSSSVSGSS